MAGPARTLVIFCHPDPGSFVGHLRDLVVEAAAARGDEVRSTDLYADGFVAEMSDAERRAHKTPGAGAAVAGYAEDLRWCRRIVFVYPTWWAGQPAMLKGWMDRVLVRGLAWDLPDGANRVKGQLRNIHEVFAVTTHGSSKLINALQGEGGKRTLFRAFRALCSWRTRCRWVALYGMDTATAVQREAFARRVASAIRR